MSNMRDDLDRFLKTEGLRMIMGPRAAGNGPRRTLTLKGFGPVSDIRPEELDGNRLNELLDAAEAKQRELENQLDALEELIDSVEARLEDAEETY